MTLLRPDPGEETEPGENDDTQQGCCRNAAQAVVPPGRSGYEPGPHPIRSDSRSVIETVTQGSVRSHVDVCRYPRDRSP